MNNKILTSFICQTDSSEESNTDNINEGKTAGRPAPKRK